MAFQEGDSLSGVQATKQRRKYILNGRVTYSHGNTGSIEHGSMGTLEAWICTKQSYSSYRIATPVILLPPPDDLPSIEWH